MPSFYPRQLPPTPPEFFPSSCQRMQYPQDSYRTCDSRQDVAYDYSRGYSQSAFQRNPILPPINNYYESSGAPILPPLRMQERLSLEDDYRLRLQEEQRSQAAQQQQQQQQQQQAQQSTQKEDKATGGVSAKLDYDMERMTNFVAESASGMYALHLSPICLADIDICRSIQPSVPIQTSFRKWVSQVLSATRLPSATILLSLHYLTVRLRDYHPTKSNPSSENHIYRLLAVALILGSKFLDDNTFINRSWSDVTGIRVSELNNLEMEWLALISFDLHCDPTDPAGLASWLRAWTDYDAQAVSRSRTARLSPLNTNVQRQSPRASRSPFQPQYKGSFADFTPQSSRPSSTYSGTPYTSADPWNRPEPTNSVEAFYNSQHRYPTLEELDHSNSLAALEQARRSTAYGGCALPLPPALASNYYSPWNQPTWGGSHPPGCNCMACSRQYMSFMGASGYPAQTAVG
ncbi:hypothetical protein D6C92_04226 [Aureobasidium pullulans]|nr:hypothetical protein D6C92_04226 [Aureobasidium pullulans]